MREELLAALLWNRPALEGPDASQGARAFVDAMNLRGGKWWDRADPGDDDDPLVVAAGAALREADGDVDGAVEAFDALSRRDEPLIQLLGLCLRLWCAREPEESQFRAAEKVIEEQDDPELKARLILKLVAAAFDHGFDDEVPQLLDKAVRWAPAETQLRRAVEVEAFNLVGRPLTSGSPPARAQRDELVAYEWITDLAANAARERLLKAVEAAARSPHVQTMTLGATPLNRPFAAERQARWAGAIWLVRDLQLQLAAHLLTESARDPRSRSSAVSMWALHGGKRVEGVIDVAEADFDADSADQVVEVLTRGRPLRGRYDPRLVEVALSCWDLVSDETAASLLDRLPPVPGEHPVGEQRAALWSVLSLRVPDVWETKFLDLADDAAARLVTTTTPSVARRMPARGAERLLSILDTPADDPLHEPRLYAALSERLGREPTNLVSAEAGDLILAVSEGSQVDKSRLRAAVEELAKRVDRLAEDARSGRFGMGRSNPVAVLAIGLERLEDDQAGGIETVLAIATDGAIARNFRYDALRGLVGLTRAGLVSQDRGLAAAVGAPEGGADAIWEDYPPALIRAAKTTLRIAAGEIDAALPSLIASARNRAVRVRLEAMDGCGLAHEVSGNPLIEATLLGGLFDPAASVVQAALHGVRRSAKVSPEAGLALNDRLRVLFGSEGRDVRAAVVALLLEVRAQDHPLTEVRDEILGLAASDRSFQVRDQLREGR